MNEKVINLRQRKKQNARDAKRRKGGENAARFGEPTCPKQAREMEEARRLTLLDQHKRDDD